MFNVARIKLYAPWLICIILAILLIICGITYFNNKQEQKSVVITQSELKDTEKLSKLVNVTPNTAVQIQREIREVQTKEPTVTYYVQSPTLERASEITEKQINKQDKTLPAVAIEKSDRTIVTTNAEEQKVDVYKINLNKAHKIKAGATMIDNKAYATVGYQAGRFEGLAHFDNKGFQGGTMLYTVYEW